MLVNTGAQMLVNTGAQMFLWYMIAFSLAIHPVVRLLDHRETLVSFF